MSTSSFDPRDRADVRLVPKALIGGRWVKGPISGEREPDRLRYMARSGGYVMVRKPRCAPFVLTEKEWAKLPLFEATA